MATNKPADTRDNGMLEPASISTACRVARELKAAVRQYDPKALALALELRVHIFETVCDVFPEYLEVFAQAVAEIAAEEEEVAAPHLGD